LPEEFVDKVANLKKVLAECVLTQSTIRQTEKLLRDNGADYFKIEYGDRVSQTYYNQYDCIWKYHGHGEDFIIYVDFD